ncbi:MAG: TPM domain-containing protein [Candidatus Azobacteroides sp.]|nr:TPM domain-containing protein [Candidatus Azobacteroides sp.]
MLTKNEQNIIVQAIRDAESKTSGEIRVHIARHCKGDALDCAVKAFNRLKMDKTRHRNGTLIYVAPEEKQLAVIGDIGINKIVPDDFWDHAVSTMLSFFKQDKLTEGICEGIRQVGILLKQYFPAEAQNINELPDDISFD